MNELTPIGWAVQQYAQPKINGHTPVCLAAREKERTDREAYEKAWPGYCRKCGGEGGHSDYEYRGEFHGAPASEQVYIACPRCVDLNICPRCGVGLKERNAPENNFDQESVIDGDEKAKCFACGWTEGDAGIHEILNSYDCGCEMP